MNSLVLPIFLEWLALNCGPAVDVSATLGSPRFRERLATARALEAAWPMSEATLRRAESSPDLEVAESARRIRQRCWNQAVAGAPWADWPLWSVETRAWVGSRCPPLDRAIRRQLLPLPPEELGYPQWENYRELSRRWALQAMHSGWATPTIVRLWFTIGRAVDADYHASHSR